MTFVLNDHETRCVLDLNAVGQDRYVDEAEVLMVGVGREDGQVSIMPGLRDCEGVTFVSWGGFDREIARRVEKLECPNWIDARILAQMVGLPASLEAFCTAIGIPAKKDPRGTRLINKYSKPLPDGTFLPLSGDDRIAMEEYCLQDVRLLQQAWRFLRPLVGEWLRCHQANWETYDRMNRRGVPIDVEACKRAQKLIGEQVSRIEGECKERFGFTTTQTAKVCEFLGTPDITRQTLEGYRSKDPDQMWVRDARLVTSRAAAKKLVPMVDMASDDGRIRSAFHYHGAHTGRGTSMGVQFQNLKKGEVDLNFFERLHSGFPVDDPIQQTQANIRGFIAAKPGKQLVIVDYSQVEARILSWIAGETFLSEAFVSGRDVYREFATQVYGVALQDVTDSQRAASKAAVLGAGYGMGPDRFIAQAASFGMMLKPQAAEALVYGYRKNFPAIPALWHEIDAGIKGLIRGRHEVFTAGKCVFTINPSRLMLRIELPSHRVLRYFRPTIDSDQRIVYQGRHGSIHCWGGHFVENICQAIAGDLKTDFMRRCDEMNFNAVMEVHDELVFEEYEEIAPHVLTTALEMMTETPEWLDCPGLIKGEGKILPRFSK